MSSPSVVTGANGHRGNSLTRRLARFEGAILRHADAAYQLARRLTRREQDAEDVVQETCLRAWQFFDSFDGGDGRTWLLAIVRNTCYTWLMKNRPPAPTTSFDAQRHDVASTAHDPAALLLRMEDSQLLRDTVELLPVELREVIVLRELGGLSYKEIAHAVAIPVGTVMSRLARGRERLQQLLARRMCKEPGGERRQGP
jgi:RNA polymerase sigma-70 factor (ECF subfamily)